jgi:hypothetical protein
MPRITAEDLLADREKVVGRPRREWVAQDWRDAAEALAQACEVLNMMVEAVLGNSSRLLAVLDQKLPPKRPRGRPKKPKIVSAGLSRRGPPRLWPSETDRRQMIAEYIKQSRPRPGRKKRYSNYDLMLIVVAVYHRIEELRSAGDRRKRLDKAALESILADQARARGKLVSSHTLLHYARLRKMLTRGRELFSPSSQFRHPPVAKSPP